MKPTCKQNYTSLFLKPVSYTHLDVYKRQTGNNGNACFMSVRIRISTWEKEGRGRESGRVGRRDLTINDCYIDRTRSRMPYYLFRNACFVNVS